MQIFSEKSTFNSDKTCKLWAFLCPMTLPTPIQLALLTFCFNQNSMSPFVPCLMTRVSKAVQNSRIELTPCNLDTASGTCNPMYFFQPHKKVELTSIQNSKQNIGIQKTDQGKSNQNKSSHFPMYQMGHHRHTNSQTTESEQIRKIFNIYSEQSLFHK